MFIYFYFKKNNPIYSDISSKLLHLLQHTTNNVDRARFIVHRKIKNTK